MKNSARGKLYVCATPIGNLEDITLRALRVLKEADLVAAEDTRHTRGLLAHFDIHTPLTSYHEHNELAKGRELIAKLREGLDVALVSESGMPAISDPGFRLVRSAIEESIPVEVLPGPSAALTALVVSGLPTDRFVFEGFLSPKAGKRDRRLAELASEPRTIILYESPHRIERTLRAIYERLGDRRIVLARELTKKFEEVRRGTVGEILESVKTRPPKGEIVLVIEGQSRRAAEP